MEPRKQAIIETLRAFITQRPGMDPRNYDPAGYRRESRDVTRDLHHASALLDAVAGCDAIDADAILKEAGSGGRLTISDASRWFVDYADGSTYNATSEADARDHWARCAGRNERGDGTLRNTPRVSIDYTTGQYFPTEYRKAVARLCAAVLWVHAREHELPKPFKNIGTGDQDWHAFKPTHDALPKALSAGDWLRAHFARRFGKGIAARYFN
jgi:hypothetical protein